MGLWQVVHKRSFLSLQQTWSKYIARFYHMYYRPQRSSEPCLESVSGRAKILNLDMYYCYPQATKSPLSYAQDNKLFKKKTSGQFFGSRLEGVGHIIHNQDNMQLNSGFCSKCIFQVFWNFCFAFLYLLRSLILSFNSLCLEPISDDPNISSSFHLILPNHNAPSPNVYEL